MDRLAIHQHLAMVGGDGAAERLDERGLAGAVVADHGQDFAGIEVEIRMVERGDAAVALAQAARLEDGRGAVAHAETLRSHWSRATATMIRNPTANFCHSTSTPESARPLRNTATMRAPTSGPVSDARPPNRLVPPITTAVMLSRFAV